MEKTFLDYFHFVPSDLALFLTLNGSKYPCLEQNIHGPKDVRAIEGRLYTGILIMECFA